MSDTQPGVLADIVNSSSPLSSTATAEAAVTPDSPRIPVALLNQTHPDHRLYKDVWTRLQLLYDGSPIIERNASVFLLERPKEPAEIYQGRLKAFTYQNILSTGLGWYVAKLFKDTPEFDLKLAGKALGPPAENEAPDETWAYYEGFLDDCDRQGTTYSAFGQEIFRQLLLYRATYILIDLPPVVQDAANAAEQQIHPYLSAFMPQSAYNWQCDAYGNLEWIVFHSEQSETAFLKPEVKVSRWYYYDQQEYRVYEHRSTDTQLSGDSQNFATLKAYGPHAMADFPKDPGDPNSAPTGRVPVVKLEIPEGLWLAGRVLLQIVDHLNQDNTLKWALFLSNLQMPVIHTDSEQVPVISETGFLQVRAGDKVEYLSPDGKTFEISGDRLQCLREETYRSMYLQAQGRPSSASASSASGYSKEMDMAPSRDVLNSFGVIMRSALQVILYLIAQVRREMTMDFDVRGLSYDDDPELNDITAAAQVLGVVTGSPTFEREVKKSMMRAYGEAWNEETKLKCADEIDKAPTDIELQQQQDQLQTQAMEQKLTDAAGRLVTQASSGKESDGLAA